MLIGISIIIILALLAGLGLGLAQRKLASDSTRMVEKINRLLPQTQCGQCGYPGCRPYAEAIAQNRAPINCCPPGGEMTINALAQLLNREPDPLDKQFGEHKPHAVAVIDDSACIGCTLCLPACPVDAIVGASRYLHVVLEAQCTGCELCIAPCPVDCIAMVQKDKPAELSTPPPSDLPCIACNQCTEICPVGLKAQTLYHQLRLHDYIAADSVGQCIECGHCEQVCPSHIPLLEYYRFGKQQQQQLKQSQQLAQDARQRYEQKQHRLNTELEQSRRFHSSQRAQLKAKIHQLRGHDT